MEHLIPADYDPMKEYEAENHPLIKYDGRAVTITLLYPVEYKGSSIAHLTLRRPKTGDQIVLEKMRNKLSDSELELELFQNLSQQPKEVFAELDPDDYYHVSLAYKGFLAFLKRKKLSDSK